MYLLGIFRIEHHSSLFCVNNFLILSHLFKHSYTCNSPSTSQPQYSYLFLSLLLRLTAMAAPRSSSSADSDLLCYVHCIWPLCNTSDKSRYLDCSLQTSDSEKPVRAICFVPKKQQVLDKVATNKSPVELKF